jgi:hypothetical protein
MRGVDDVERQSAETVRDLSLSAITDLTRMLAVGEGHCAAEEFRTLKRAVAGIIGLIQTEILDGIRAQYPELNDLR